MNTISYTEVQENFADVLQQATKENLIIDGTNGNRFLLSIIHKTPPTEKHRNLSERFAGALHLTDEQYNDFQTQLSESRNEWERNIF